MIWVRIVVIGDGFCRSAGATWKLLAKVMNKMQLLKVE